jgi:hypothetical protein
VGAHIAATLTTDPTQACIYSYEKGDKTVHGLAMPARRVFFFFQDNTAAAANADGWKLFDAAVGWLTGASQNNQQPKISWAITGTQLTLTWTNGGTLQETAALSTTWADVSTSGSFTVNTTSGPYKFYRVKK